MEFNQEARVAHKRTFTDFLDRDHGQGAYIDKINRMRENNKHRLLVDLNDLRQYDGELTRSIIRQPGEYLQAFDDALDDLVKSIDGKYLKESEEVHVGFEGQLGLHKVTPRELLSHFLGSLVCVEGIVTKCSLVRPKVVKSVHYCPATGNFLTREYRDVTSTAGAPTGAVYPTRDEAGNLLVTEFGLCQYRDHQTLAIQEMPENAPPGQLPRSIDVIVEDDLVDSCKPGDRVGIVGVYKAVPTQGAGGMSGTFRTVVIANNISQLNRDIKRPQFTTTDLKMIRQIAGRDDTWDVLGDSLAPSIFGHEEVKKALVLLLLGGCEKNLKNGTHIRGDINMMMVGDPSVAKSQILRAIMNIAPLAISTTGRGSSGVGLTAAVTQDQETGERRLEAGAMVLADRGVVCIDEFDKMSDLDRVAIHEVMEQQTVTIAKAGIHASLNARCSVVAAANPIYGNYDHALTPTKNIGLPDSLLSRFDLLFIVLDNMDAERDRQISEHVLRMHRYRNPGDEDGLPQSDVPARRFEDEEEVEGQASIYVKYDRLLHGDKRLHKGKREVLTIKFLKKFIHYAKGRTPKLTEEACDQIAEAYASMRAIGMSEAGKSDSGTLPITARTLETMIRLSTGHAKLKLRKEVGAEDVTAALKLLENAIYHREMNDIKEKAAREEADANRGERGGRGGGGGGVIERLGRRRRGAQEAAAPGGEVGEGPAGEGPSGEGASEEAPTNGQSGGGRRVRGRTSLNGSAATADNADVAQAEASLQALAEEDAAMPPVAPDRVQKFRSSFITHVVDNRLEILSGADLLVVVNRNNAQPFTQAELDMMLADMEGEDRIMYANGTIHMI